MTVEELIKWLGTVPRNANIVIGGEVVAAVTIKKGRIREGYSNKQFIETDKGNDCAVIFMHHTEFSDGHVGLSEL